MSLNGSTVVMMSVHGCRGRGGGTQQFYAALDVMNKKQALTHLFVIMSFLICK